MHACMTADPRLAHLIQRRPVLRAPQVLCVCVMCVCVCVCVYASMRASARRAVRDTSAPAHTHTGATQETHIFETLLSRAPTWSLCEPCGFSDSCASMRSFIWTHTSSSDRASWAGSHSWPSGGRPHFWQMFLAHSADDARYTCMYACMLCMCVCVRACMRVRVCACVCVSAPTTRDSPGKPPLVAKSDNPGRW